MKSLQKPCFLWLMLGTTQLAALTIEIDYSYDTHNFFDTAEKRGAMEAVAGFFEDIIADNLLRIDPSEFSNSTWTAFFTHPSSGNSESIQDLVVSEDKLIVYVGALPLPTSISGQGGPGGLTASGTQAWLDRVRGRGKSEALFNPPSAVAPWGGSISFNSDANWNFSLTENLPGREFITVALHEMMHVLGIGTADSWDALRSGGTFNGAAAIQSYGSAPGADGGHLLDADSTLFGSFDTTHGMERPALMLPVSIDTGTNFDVATDLDLAVLEDIGWEIRPVAKVVTTAPSLAGAAFSWQSVSFLDYRIERGSDLASFPDGSGTFSGNGTILNWSDPAPPAGRAFYRLAAEPNVPMAAAAPLAAEETSDSEFSGIRTITVKPRFITDCGCPG